MEVDARLGRPPRFTGTETQWPDWSFQARAYFDTVSQSMADHIDAVEANADRAIPLSTLNKVATENARKMFYALPMLLQGPPSLLLKKTCGDRPNQQHAITLMKLVSHLISQGM